MIDSVCPLCAQMVPGSLVREGIPGAKACRASKVAGDSKCLDSGNHMYVSA